MKGWVSLVGWPVADGLPTLVVTHQLQVERRTGKVRRPETDVLPLCHATFRIPLLFPGLRRFPRAEGCGPPGGANKRRQAGVSLICPMTNYELVRWLVEMPSRDVGHYINLYSPKKTAATLKHSSTSIKTNKAKTTTKSVRVVDILYWSINIIFNNIISFVRQT